MTDTPLEIGQTAPPVSLPRDGGDIVSLADYAGQAIVLYFYPRDDTPGCTKEAIGFTAHAADFDVAGAKVIGISKDSVAKHEKFIAKHDLNIPLASDEHGTTCEDYGVWGEKQMYGKTFHGIERSTFVIDADGRIAGVWRKVKVPGHVEEVLDAVRAL
jgi:peroxiredoxin Q/BCP